MIRINLLGEKIDRTGTYAAHGLALAGTVLATLIACFVFHDSKLSDLELLTNEKTLLESQLNKLREKTKQVENLEKDKKLLSEKLTTIAKLKVKKSAPVHLLDDISSYIPQRSWMTSVKQKTDGLEFQGVALDPQTVSSYMTQLATSKWIDTIELIYSRQQVKDGVPVQEFSFLVKLKNPLDVNKPKTEKAERKIKSERSVKIDDAPADAAAAPGGDSAAPTTAPADEPKKSV
ncbi:MAG: PilN domain-containing protein [Bdellovibrionota bacterium]